MAELAAYGSNPHAGINPNADHGWGGFAWPLGVPAHLLAVVTIPGGVRLVVRKELAELVALNYEIARVKYGRTFERGWTGGYMNRPITGTFTASNHSRGKAIDNDAATNPMSNRFICDIPPRLVRDWESTGWYWGGRYSGKFDTMHFEYCYSPADVARHTAGAREILRAAQSPISEHPSTPTDPTPTPEDTLSAEEVHQIKQHVDNAFAAFRAELVGKLDNTVIPEARAARDAVVSRLDGTLIPDGKATNAAVGRLEVAVDQLPK